MLPGQPSPVTGGYGAAADGHGDRAGQYEDAGTPPGAHAQASPQQAQQLLQHQQQQAMLHQHAMMQQQHMMMQQQQQQQQYAAAVAAQYHAQQQQHAGGGHSPAGGYSHSPQPSQGNYSPQPQLQPVNGFFGAAGAPGGAGAPRMRSRRSLVAEEYNHERLDGDDFLATDWVPPSREKARVQHMGVPHDGM
jgi:hypothetical protein